MMMFSNLMKSVGLKFVTVGTVLCFLTLGSASIGNAETTNLSGSFKEKGACDDGETVGQKETAVRWLLMFQ